MGQQDFRFRLGLAASIRVEWGDRVTFKVRLSLPAIENEGGRKGEQRDSARAQVVAKSAGPMEFSRRQRFGSRSASSTRTEPAVLMAAHGL